jgi:predicted nucleic acid-binding protein
MKVETKILETFIDTNILVYSIDTSLENRVFHRASLKVLRPTERELLYISPQILAEFYAVITSASAVKNPIAPLEAISRIKRLSQMPNLKILQISPQVQEKWLELLELNPVKGSQVFDLFHLATMLTSEIKRIYTFNDGDFNWYQNIDVIIPT